MIVTILIIVGAVVVLVVAGIIVGYFINHETGARASGEHNFRPEAATRVTLPLRLEPRMHPDHLAATFGRGHLYADLPPAAPYRPDRLAVMAAEYEPPEEEVMPSDAMAQRSSSAATGHRMNLPASASPGPVSGGGELAPHVLKALTRAGSEDTIVTSHDLEYIVGGDPWDGLGSSDAWLDRLFGATA